MDITDFYRIDLNELNVPDSPSLEELGLRCTVRPFHHQIRQ